MVAALAPGLVLRLWAASRMDAAGYLHFASIIWRWPNPLTYYQPLYPMLISIVGLTALPWIQVAAWAAAAFLAGDLVRRATRSMWAAAAVTVLLALDLRVILYGYLVLTESLAVSLICFVTWSTYRGACEGRRGFLLLSCVALFALVLLRSGYTGLFVLITLAALIRATVRRTSLLLTAAAVLFPLCGLLAVKVAYSQRYTGSPTGNTGINLIRVLAESPHMVVSLPQGDPVREEWVKHHTLKALVDSREWAWLNTFVPRSYARGVLAEPGELLRVAWQSFVKQERDTALGWYADNPNLARMGVAWLFPWRAAALVVQAARSTVFIPALLLVLPPFLAWACAHRRLRWGLLLPWAFHAYTTATNTLAFAPCLSGDPGRMAITTEATFVMLLGMVVAVYAMRPAPFWSRVTATFHRKGDS